MQIITIGWMADWLSVILEYMVVRERKKEILYFPYGRSRLQKIIYEDRI